MPHAEFFTRFGMHVVKGFLDPALCAAIRAEMAAATAVPGTVWDHDDTYTVDERTRRTKIAQVSKSTVDLMGSRLEALTPALERHFDVAAVGWRKPQFLLYRQGDFFAAHRDSSKAPTADVITRNRRVSVVVFLNAESEQPAPDTYGGGNLAFYGLVQDARGRTVGLPVVGETGLLIAFRPEVLHSVTPVTRGERYAVVNWLAH